MAKQYTIAMKNKNTSEVVYFKDEEARKAIPKDLVLQDNKVYLLREDDTIVGSGLVLPSSSGSITGGFSGDYNDLTNKPVIPSAYTLPVASATQLGGVKIGSGLSITDGVLSVVSNGSAGVADSINWDNIVGKPAIPSKLSELTNDSNFVNKQYVDSAVHSHSNKSILDSITQEKINQWDSNSSGSVIVNNIDDKNIATDKTYSNQKIESRLLEIGGDIDAVADDVEALNKRVSVLEDNESVIPTKVSELQNDSNFITNSSADNTFAKKSELIAAPNFVYRINMIGADEEAHVTTTGEYPNIVITFNIPMGSVSPDIPVTPDEPTVPQMYYGRLSIAEVGGSVIQYNQITANMIKNGANMTKTEAKVIGKTSMGLASTTAEGDYIVVAVPSTYKVTKDNGFSGKVVFSESVAGTNGQAKLVIDGVSYDLYGEILNSQAEIFVYIDEK